jgi:Protein of unknown function (DUF3134)
MLNPSLREEPRNKQASILTSGQQVSILDWLESTGRLVARDGGPISFDYREDVEELQELMVGEEGGGGFMEEEDDDDEPAADDGDED